MENLIQEAAALNINLTSAMVVQFETLLRELKLWNEHTNLTAIRTDADIIRKHFLDSLSVLQALPKDARTLIDVGSGAGFPGLPIAIAFPPLTVTLMESVQKKSAFLEHMSKALGIGTHILTTRAEEAAHLPAHREMYDVAVARGVAELRVIAEYCLPFVKVGGVFIAQKNVGTEEAKNAEHAIQILGGTLAPSILLTGALSGHELIIIKKTKSTPSDYPRKTGTPHKKPL